MKIHIYTWMAQGPSTLIYINLASVPEGPDTNASGFGATAGGSKIQALVLSAEGSASKVHAIPSELLLFSSSHWKSYQGGGRYATDIKGSALCWQVPLWKGHLHLLHNGPYFCHGTSTCRAKSHIQWNPGTKDTAQLKYLMKSSITAIEWANAFSKKIFVVSCIKSTGRTPQDQIPLLSPKGQSLP